MDREFFPRDRHAKIIGATRRGKTGFMELVARAILKDGREGLLVTDPHESISRAVLEYLSRPANNE